jgi:hypothetical protein
VRHAWSILTISWLWLDHNNISIEPDIKLQTDIKDTWTHLLGLQLLLSQCQDVDMWKDRMDVWATQRSRFPTQNAMTHSTMHIKQQIISNWQCGFYNVTWMEGLLRAVRN